MECLLQYWDELDDLFWLVPALKERIRRGFLSLLSIFAVLGVALLGARTAQANPDAAVLVAVILGTGLLLRAAFGGPDLDHA